MALLGRIWNWLKNPPPAEPTVEELFEKWRDLHDEMRDYERRGLTPPRHLREAEARAHTTWSLALAERRK